MTPTGPQTTYQISQLVFPVLLLGFSDSVFPSCVIESWTWCHSMVLQFFLTFGVAPLLLLSYVSVWTCISWMDPRQEEQEEEEEDDDDEPMMQGQKRSDLQTRCDRALGRFLLYVDMSCKCG